MAILTASGILDRINAGDIYISDFDEKRLGPNSYNLRLGKYIGMYSDPVLDMYKEPLLDLREIPESGIVLYPGGLYLGSTIERTKVKNLAPLLEGRSSLGRLGVSVHVTAGFGDNGFDGRWTLEITVQIPIRVYPGVEFCQIYFETLEGDPSVLYKGKYQGQTGPTPSRLWWEGVDNGRV